MIRKNIWNIVAVKILNKYNVCWDNWQIKQTFVYFQRNTNLHKNARIEPTAEKRLILEHGSKSTAVERIKHRFHCKHKFVQPTVSLVAHRRITKSYFMPRAEKTRTTLHSFPRFSLSTAWQKLFQSFSSGQSIQPESGGNAWQRIFLPGIVDHASRPNDHARDRRNALASGNRAVNACWKRVTPRTMAPNQRPRTIRFVKVRLLTWPGSLIPLDWSGYQKLEKSTSFQLIRDEFVRTDAISVDSFAWSWWFRIVPNLRESVGLLFHSSCLVFSLNFVYEV